MKAIISLGSNINQQENILKAKTLLQETFPNIAFSSEVWTAPIGLRSDNFLNLTASFDTFLTQKEVLQQLKVIETRLGDSHLNHQKGIVKMDIDLNEYDGKCVKEIVWQVK